jgi:hypothetical protein
MRVEQPPGTVSKILWHFTGGPRWNSAKNRQETRPKPAGEAYEALLSILRSKQLDLGQYRELVKVRIPRLRAYNATKQEPEKFTNEEIRSSQVCCLADIPVAHLSYQARRYGKIAVGFHRNAAVQHGFNPVFYTLHDAKVLRSVYECSEQLRYRAANALRDAQSNIEWAVEDLKCQHGHQVDVDGARLDIGWEMRDIEDAVTAARTSLREFLAFVKTFDQRQFASIYCEREWRSIRAFPFRLSHVAMIVLPAKDINEVSYFNQFVTADARRLRIPRSIPVVPWEDLVEH